METQHIGALITVGLAWSGFLVAVIKWLLDRNMTSAERIIGLQDEKINALTSEIRKTNDELAKMRAELPVIYIRKDDCRSSREDWVREISALEHKVSGLVERINVKLDQLMKEMYERNA